MTFAELKPRFDCLLGASLDQASLEAWMASWAALSEEIAEESGWLYIRTACDTGHKGHEKAFLDFQEQVQPKIHEAEQALKVKLLDSGLKPTGLGRFLRGLQADRELFREENLKLQAELAALIAEHGRIEGAQSVSFDGQERTLQSMALLQEEGDRGLRERAWRAVAGRVAQDREALDALYEKMQALRVRMAHNAGFASYTPFRFKEYWRFDYGIDEALALHEAVFGAMGPLARKIEAWRAEQLGLSRLRPWDLGVDPLGGEPLRPFEGGKALFEGVKRIYARLDPVPAENLQRLWDKGLLDLDSRKGKRAGGFNETLPKSKASFIFMNAVGSADDVSILLHEGGHALHSRLCEGLPSHFQRAYCIEWAEVASMSMELLGLAHLGEFYADKDAERAKLDHLMGVADRLCRICVTDAFQHRLYADPGMSRAARHAAFTELNARLGSGVDYSGLEEHQGSRWQRILHIFVVPFYMIEYAMAQLGAMQIWQNSLKDPKAAFAKYKAALSLSADHSLPELFAAAGAEFNLSPESLGRLAGTLEAEINASLKRLGRPPLPG